MHDTDRRQGFEAIVGEVYEPLQRYLRRRCPDGDADEVLNDVLLVIWRRLDDAPAGALLPWCYGIARRCLANHRRSTLRRLRLVQRIGSAPAAEEPRWVPEADAALHDAMSNLGDMDREVVRLWAWERLEPREIADVVGATPNAVSVRLTRARRQLESELARQDAPVSGHKRFKGPKEVTP